MQLETMQEQGMAAVKLAVFLSCIPLVPALVVGLVSSVLQAATQIQDQSLSFVPKMVVAGAVIFFFGPTICLWFAQFAAELFQSLSVPDV